MRVKIGWVDWKVNIVKELENGELQRAGWRKKDVYWGWVIQPSNNILIQHFEISPKALYKCYD